MGTTTDKYGLYKPTPNVETGWGALMNAVIDLLDKFPLFIKGADVVSEAALFTTASFPTDGNHFDVTGTVPVTSMITSGKVGTIISLHFDNILTITHSANIVLPRETNLTTEVGEELTFIEYASGQWRCIGGSRLYTRAHALIVCVNDTVVCNNNEVVII